MCYNCNINANFKQLLSSECVMIPTLYKILKVITFFEMHSSPSFKLINYN